MQVFYKPPRLFCYPGTLASQDKLQLAVRVSNTKVLLNLGAGRGRIESREPEGAGAGLFPEPATNVVVVALQSGGRRGGTLVVGALGGPASLTHPDLDLGMDLVDAALDIPVRVLEGLEAEGVLDVDSLPVGEAVGDGNVAGLGDNVIGAVDPSSPGISVANL